MTLKSLTLWSALPLLLVATACEQSSPVKPTDVATSTVAAQAATTTAKSGVTLGAPALASPASGTAIANVKQPATVSWTNAVQTGSAPMTYLVEVATDANFNNKAFSKDNIAEGSSGTTTFTLDKLGPGATYYWRVRGTTAGVTTPYSDVRTIVIGQQVILNTPVLSLPATGATVTKATPTLVTTNVGRSGPVDKVTYTFQLADSAAFSNIVFSATGVAEGSGTTSVDVTRALTTNTTYFWRVQATDTTNQVTTAFSNVFSFKVQLFDMKNALIWNNPQDMGSWPETAKITMIQTSGDSIIVDFDKRLSNDHWPSVGFGDGDLEYTLGMCAFINGQWNCSAVVQFWYGRDLDQGGRPWEVALNWFYDTRWGNLKGFQPAPGEIVGIFVAAGNNRDLGNVIVKERSNVVMIPWYTDYYLGNGVKK